ncbi:ABC transporter ATP-binding protein [Glycomyces sp. NRRL B-16210]|uniref:ABC transporter ATP-binding protein n=1 Tax=Glycomyces sp. NRRL B-16210 TaxID=1463821 RepID=UPI0005591ED3|nr:ABC transporter ATP-binding protein [Glycomyces sp. NRRL B-16210]
MTLASIRDLSAHYSAGGTRFHALDEVALDVRSGQILGVVGESGCGKSTMASVLSLNPGPSLRVTAGTLSVAGTDIDLTDATRGASASHRALRGGTVALLPQGALNALNPTRRVGAQAHDILAAGDRRIKRAVSYERAAARLEALDLPPRALRAYPHQLSGGMRQRVVTALATLRNPRLLVADEPSSALDVSSQRLLVDLLRRLIAEGLVEGIVFITHDVALLSELADRIAVMYAGRVVEEAPARELVSSPRHPYSQALLASVLVPEPGTRGRRLTGIPGSPPDLRAPLAGCAFAPRCEHAMDVCATDRPPRVVTGSRDDSCWRSAETEEAAHVG